MLGEGRVDPKTGHLECCYHGWQFDENGTCTKIPQAENAELLERNCDQLKATALPTCVANADSAVESMNISHGSDSDSRDCSASGCLPFTGGASFLRDRAFECWDLGMVKLSSRTPVLLC